MIFYIVRTLQKLNVNRILKSRNTYLILWASCEVHFWRVWGRVDCAITAPHCIGEYTCLYFTDLWCIYSWLSASFPQRLEYHRRHCVYYELCSCWIVSDTGAYYWPAVGQFPTRHHGVCEFPASCYVGWVSELCTGTPGVFLYCGSYANIAV